MYGREGQLKQLMKDRKNPELNKFTRQMADRNMKKIVSQFKDKRLMQLRSYLMKATAAGDHVWVEKYTKQMRDYEKRDKEAGL